MLKMKQITLNIKRLATVTIVAVWILVMSATNVLAYTMPDASGHSDTSSQSTPYVCKLEGPIPTSDANTCPVLNQGGVGMQRIAIPPGHLLTPHWHPNSNETTYCLEGEGVVGLVSPDPTSTAPTGANSQLSPFNEGEMVFLPQGYVHYFVNQGTEDFVLLLTFDNPNFDILTFADAFQQLPDYVREAAIWSKAGHNPVIPYK